MPSITVPATLQSLTSAQQYLKDNIPARFEAQTSNLLLVAEELLVNVFSYAYPAGNEGKAEIRLDVRGNSLIFTVKDWGAPFNPFVDAPAPDLTSDIESRPVGGLGIFLIKQVSEHQSYVYKDRTNTIEISFGEKTRQL